MLAMRAFMAAKAKPQSLGSHGRHLRLADDAIDKTSELAYGERGSLRRVIVRSSRAPRAGAPGLFRI
jgi:hypothetical protein